MAYIDAKGVLTEGESWVGIDTHTCTGDDAEVTFTSQTGSTDYKKNWSQYVDLILIISARSTRSHTVDDMKCKLNNKASAYWTTSLYMGSTVANGYTYSSPLAYVELGGIFAASSASTCFGTHYIQFFEINSGKYKSILSEWGKDANASDGQVGMNSITWADTSDTMLSTNYLNRIDLYPANGDFTSGSKFDLFGVLPRMTENTAVAY